MGEVYRARDSRLRREVALKVLPEIAGADPDRRERFTREAHAVAALNHPHIVTIHSVEEEGTAVFHGTAPAATPTPSDSSAPVTASTSPALRLTLNPYSR